MSNTPMTSGSSAGFGFSVDGFMNWATKTPKVYGFTIILLFSLGLFARFLGAVKTQLENHWKRGLKEGNRRHARHDSYVGLHDNSSEEVQPLKIDASDTTMSTEVQVERRGVGSFWTPATAWNAKRDGIRAFLEFARALIAYAL